MKILPMRLKVTDINICHPCDPIPTLAQQILFSKVSNFVFFFHLVDCGMPSESYGVAIANSHGVECKNGETSLCERHCTVHKHHMA